MTLFLSIYKEVHILAPKKSKKVRPKKFNNKDMMKIMFD